METEVVVNFSTEYCTIICHMTRSLWLRVFARRMVREGFEYSIGIAYPLACGLHDGELE